MYSNEAERANTIYGGCKFKKTLWSPWFMKNNSALKGLNCLAYEISYEEGWCFFRF